MDRILLSFGNDDLLCLIHLHSNFQLAPPCCLRDISGIRAFYRLHVSDATSLEQLNISLNHLSNSVSAPQIWLSGDFNAPYIDWSTPMVIPGSLNPITLQLLTDIVQHYGLSQVVDEPTGCRICLFFLQTSQHKYKTSQYSQASVIIMLSWLHQKLNHLLLNKYHGKYKCNTELTGRQ